MGHWPDYPDTTYGVVTGAELEQWDEAIYELKHLLLHVDDYGAIGDGVAFDTEAILAAIADCSAAGGGIVNCRRDGIYLVTLTGTKSVRNPSGSTGTLAYCIDIPSNVTLDLNGATLKLGAAAGDTCLIVNQIINGDATDHDVGVTNGTLDGNSVQYTAASLVQITGVARPTLYNLKLSNGTRVGVQAYGNTDGYYDRLFADSYAGNPFQFGQPFSGSTEDGATFGRIIARNTTADAINAFNFPGNVFLGVVPNCTIDTLVGKSCAAAVKVYGSQCTDVVIGKVLFENGTSSNCGVKVQTTCQRVSFGQIVCVGGSGTGFFSDTDCVDISIGSYIGNGNGTAGTSPDLWIDGTRFSVGTAHVRNAGAQGATVRATAVDARIGTLIAVNAGQITGAASGSSIGLSTLAGSCTVDDLVCVDDQGTRTMLRGLSVDNASAVLRVLNYKWSSSASGGAPWNGWSGDDVLVFNPRIGTDKLAGELSPAGAATTTAVSNNNITIVGTYVQPIIEIVPLNAAAQTLGIPRVTFTAGTMTFNHAAAAGTEKYSWRIVAYRKSTTQAA